MICPFCKEEIAYEAIKCKHCQSMLNTPPSSSAAPTTAKAAVTDEDDGDLDYHERLRAMFEGKKYRVILGLPIFSNSKEQLSVFWWFALLYSPLNWISYAVNGMWKKVVTLIGAYALLYSAMKAGGDKMIGICLLIFLALAMYVGAAMRHDEYRRHVLKEDFWR